MSSGWARIVCLWARAVNNADHDDRSYPKTNRNLRALNLGAVERAFDVLRKASSNQSFDSLPAISLIIQLMQWDPATVPEGHRMTSIFHCNSVGKKVECVFLWVTWTK